MRLTKKFWQEVFSTFQNQPWREFICHSSQQFHDVWYDPEKRRLIRKKAREFLKTRSIPQNEVWVGDPESSVLFNLDDTDEGCRSIRLKFLQYCAQ